MNKNKELVIILILGALAAIGPFSIDMYLPGFPAIAADLHTDIAHVGLSLTSYFIGISVGQLVYGPLIDRFGRRRPLLFGLLLYMAAAAFCAFAPTIHWLIGLRLLLALGGCVGMVASRAVVRDLFPPSETARVFSTLLLVMGVAPIVAPTIGGYVTALLGWRFIFAVLFGISVLVFFAVLRYLPESKPEDKSISLHPANITKKFWTVLKDQTFRSYAIAGSFGSAGMFAYITGSPYVYMEILGFTEQQYGWLFGLNAFGLIAASQFNRVLLKRRSSADITLLAGTLQFLTGLLLILSSAFGLIPLSAVLVLIFSYLVWQGFIFPNATALALEPFTTHAGSASALIGSMQMVVGAVASGLVSYFHDGTAVPMAAIMAVCTSIAFVALLGAKINPRVAPAVS
ncbi:multidrug effflux MFS transporter [Pontibacter ummariensis]|uniref:multidrug effflux MFS transporter n=1 Tax=Pontibacter ummariensis TaxID=1610492 RepID=UPI000B78F83C|nr:multidrug effflux MFS transporter [Pontibacter ummariensis]